MSVILKHGVNERKGYEFYDSRYSCLRQQYWMVSLSRLHNSLMIKDLPVRITKVDGKENVEYVMRAE